MNPEMNPETNPRPLEERMAEMDKRIRQSEALTVGLTEAVRLAPVIEASRESAVLVRYSALATRVHGIEEVIGEMQGIVVDSFELIREVHEVNRELHKRLRGGGEREQ